MTIYCVREGHDIQAVSAGADQASATLIQITAGDTYVNVSGANGSYVKLSDADVGSRVTMAFPMQGAPDVTVLLPNSDTASVYTESLGRTSLNALPSSIFAKEHGTFTLLRSSATGWLLL